MWGVVEEGGFVFIYPHGFVILRHVLIIIY